MKWVWIITWDWTQFNKFIILIFSTILLFMSFCPQFLAQCAVMFLIASMRNSVYCLFISLWPHLTIVKMCVIPPHTWCMCMLQLFPSTQDHVTSFLLPSLVYLDSCNPTMNPRTIFAKLSFNFNFNSNLFESWVSINFIFNTSQTFCQAYLEFQLHLQF